MSIEGDLKKHTLNLRDGDFAYIESIFRPRGVPASLAIRTLVANYVDERRAQESESDPIQLKMDI